MPTASGSDSDSAPSSLLASPSSPNAPSDPAPVPSGEVVPVVTLASLHGSGGARIAPRLAERLGVPFLDRALPAAVAERQGVPVAAVESLGRPQRRRHRLVELLSKAFVSAGDEGPTPRLGGQERALRNEIDDFLARASRTGGVVLGRGSVVVLKSVPGALHVFLGGPFDARVRRIMEIEGLDRETAAREVKRHDRARVQYVQESYGVDGQDPGLYHLLIDTTAFDEDACVHLLVTASQARREHEHRTSGKEER